MGLMAATYLTFAYWLLYRDGWLALPLYLPASTFWRAAGVVLVYWALFAAPTVEPGDPSFSDRRRAAHLALDCGLAWGLIGLMLPRADPRAFTEAFGAFGLVLLAFSFLAARRPATPALVPAAARTAGLVLLLVAAAVLGTGSSAALVLALLGLGLAMAAQYADSRVLRAITFLVSLLAAALGTMDARTAALPAVTLGALLVFTGWWVSRHEDAAAGPNLGALYFCALGFAVWLVATLFRAPVVDRAALLAIEAVVVTAGVYLIGLRPAAFPAQAFLIAAHVVFLGRANEFAGPSWAVLAIVLATLVLGAWWRGRSGSPRILGLLRSLFTAGYAAAVVAVLFVWLRWRLPPESAGSWLIVPAILAVAALVYAVSSGDWAMGVLGQAFLLVSLAEFWLRWEERPRPGGLVMLVPIVALVVLAAIVDHWRSRGAPEASGMAWAGRASLLARLLATLLLVVWVYWYVPPHGQFVLLEVAAVIVLIGAGERSDLVGVAASVILSTGGLLLLWIAGGGADGFHVADLFAFVLLLAQQQLWRRRYPHLVPAPLHDPSMVMGVLSLWRWVHLVVSSTFGSDWLAVGWAVVGFVACGLGLWLREARYRQLGFVILFFALGRVAFRDYRDPQVLPRVASALVIGTMLLALGFVYRRYPDRVAERG
jgi:hypothetical protein